MTPRRQVVAVATFVAITDDGYRTVAEGERLDASDEVVRANPEHFEAAIEQATAASGEKRKR